MRVLVVGPSGAGKSTLARRIGAELALPVIHLDAHYFRPGWIEPSAAEWDAQITQLVTGDAWVMDGNYSRTFAPRLAAADAIVFLDLSRWRCMASVIGRWWKTRGRVREDMAPGCPEKVSLTLLGFIWTYHTRSRPKVLQMLDAGRATKRIVVLRSRAEIDRFAASELRDRA